MLISKNQASNTIQTRLSTTQDKATDAASKGDKSNATGSLLPRREDQTNANDLRQLNNQAARLGDPAAIANRAITMTRLADRPTSASERVNIGLDTLLDGTVTQSGGPTRPDQLTRTSASDLLANTPGTPLGQDSSFSTPFERLREQADGMIDLLGSTGAGHAGQPSNNDAAEQSLLSKWGSQNNHNPLPGGGSTMASLRSQYGTRGPELGGDPAQRNLQYVSTDTGSQEAQPELSTTDKVGIAASALVNAVAKGVGGFISSTIMTVLTAPTDPEDTTSGIGVFQKWAKGEDVSLGSQAQGMADLKKKGAGTTEYQDPDAVGQTAPTAETLGRAEAKRGGLINPANTDDEINRAEAAARILAGKQIGDQAVIRTTSDEAGQDKVPLPDIEPKDTGLTNPSNPMGGDRTPPPAIDRPEGVPGSHGGLH